MAMAGDMGADAARQREAARMIATGYRTKLREYGKMGFMRVWYDHIEQASVLDAFSVDAHQRVKATFAKARSRNHLQVLGKMTDLVDDQHRIRELHPFVIRETHTENAYDTCFAEVVSAAADSRVFANGHWTLNDSNAALRSIHHLGGGLFARAGEGIQAQPLTSA